MHIIPTYKNTCNQNYSKTHNMMVIWSPPLTKEYLSGIRELKIS